MSVWVEILTKEQISEYHDLTAKVDPGFARRDKEFMEAQTVSFHDGAAKGAWDACDGERFQLHRSYAKVKRDAENEKAFARIKEGLSK